MSKKIQLTINQYFTKTPLCKKCKISLRCVKKLYSGLQFDEMLFVEIHVLGVVLQCGIQAVSVLAAEIHFFSIVAENFNSEPH